MGIQDLMIKGNSTINNTICKHEDNIEKIKEDKANRSMEVEKAIMTNKAIVKIKISNIVMT
jgi:hypothetical protein